MLPIEPFRETRQRLDVQKPKRIMCIVSTSQSSLWSGAESDVSVGTVWRVKETLWKERFKAKGIPYESDRYEHFGLSILRFQDSFRPLERVPMLHGSSDRSRNCFSTTDLDGTERRTHFGHLRPVPMPDREILDHPEVKREDWKFAWRFESLRAVPNDRGKR
jgi:hypothetical protein